MKCPYCDATNPSSKTQCIVCHEHMGYPNVRTAAQKKEVRALKKRFHAERRKAASGKCRKVFNQFYRQVTNNSKAVVCMNAFRLHDLVKQDNALYVSFYQRREAGTQLESDNFWDDVRVRVDAFLFPYYQKEICFGALSLNNQGVRGYGDYSVGLKSDMLVRRSSVFHENSIMFFQRNAIQVAGSLPPGYRATWAKRAMLVAAKVRPKLKPTSTNFEHLIMNSTGDPDRDEFIEVHIFGPVHRRIIERVTARVPQDDSVQAVHDEIERLLGQMGIPLETIT